jgi:hypothetical protein
MRETANSVRQPRDRFSRVLAYMMLAGATGSGVLSVLSDRKLFVSWAVIVMAYAIMELRYGFQPPKTVAMIKLGLGVLSVVAIVAAVMVEVLG